MIYGAELEDVVLDVYKDLNNMPIFVSYSGSTSASKSSNSSSIGQSLDDILLNAPSTPVDNSLRAGTDIDSIFGYIYTSGTTGLPKASIIQHLKYCNIGIGGQALFSDTDVGYGGGMPLYHSAAGMIGIGYVVCAGLTYVIRKKFSAKNWLSDIRKYKVTIGQYIGELARYILSK